MAETIRAYAKVNLHLEVLNRRDDGYHNIFSLQAGVALHDLLKLDEVNLHDSPGEGVSVTIRNSGGEYGHIIDEMPEDENLISRAAVLFCERAGLGGTISFSIEKNIPAGAGLGGGSSDAAGTLKLLNARYKTFDAGELAAMGAGLGADVPYSLRGGYALCTGTGDVVRPLAGRLKYRVVIAVSDVHIDTGWAYRSLGRSAGPALREVPDDMDGLLAAALESGSIERVRGLLRNDFEKTVFREYPAIGKIKERLAELGADYAVMTGSGSSLIGLFSSQEKIECARAALAGDGTKVVITGFV